MSRPTSAAMLAAMALIQSGMGVREAAEQAGITYQSIYRSPLYLAWRGGHCPTCGKPTKSSRR